MRSACLFAALGNPGVRYCRTRHNVGFFIADSLAACHHLAWKQHEDDALVCSLSLHAVPLLLVKPQTFMNLSGRPVAILARQHGIPLENIVVVHDDLDLPLGRLKISHGRGAGGHRGILSVIEELGSRNFGRMRVGIGRPPACVDPAEYVLTDFSEDEWSVIYGILPKVEHALDLFLLEGVTRAMNIINNLAGDSLKNSGTVL